MPKLVLNIVSLFILLNSIRAQQSGLIDVQHYKYDITLTDANDSIKGIATIRFKTVVSTPSPVFDLAALDQSGKGMRVESVYEGANKIGYKQAGDKLLLMFNKSPSSDEEKEIIIAYKGIPKDGLIISKNKYGDRTFFADNWPNRAHHWIPCNDVPADKASVEFIVTAPARYQVISNGVQVEETNMPEDKKRTHWKEDSPIPTKVMVIGAARFAVGRLDSLGNVPITAWVYPQDRDKGFYDYALAVPILHFFSNYIGPYPYQKLANVQSKTIFGGMENASAIFYSENSVTGNRTSEDLLAHEIAHQWFGNTASEKSFPHLWLSEGFATYMTDIYLEQKYGKDSMNKRLQKEREQVIRFAELSNKPVVDTVSTLMDLLNANSYQKGAWVLHMLRNEVGDSIFHSIIKTYYQQYKGSNADTRDFEQVAERLSGKDLKPFFDQWLFAQSIPSLKVFWYPEGGTIEVNQLQENVFTFPLQISFKAQDGKQITQQLLIKNKTEKFKLNRAATKEAVKLDPNYNLLFKASVINVYDAKMYER